MDTTINWRLVIASSCYVVAVLFFLAGDTIGAQAISTDQVVAQSLVKPSVELGGQVSNRIKCTSTINVEVDDSYTGRDWPTTPVQAKYARVEVGYVNSSTPQLAICVYTAFGGEFKIKRAFDQPYKNCTTFTQQGGTGGVQCR